MLWKLAHSVIVTLAVGIAGFVNARELQTVIQDIEKSLPLSPFDAEWKSVR